MDILVIVLLNIILYFRTLKFSIIVDDIKCYDRIQKVKFEKGIKEKIREFNIRTYGGGTFGTRPTIDHALCIFTHTCIAVLIYMAFGYSTTSFVAALLYSCNPVTHSTSMWLNGRRYALATIFGLLMLVYKPFGIVFYPMAFFWDQPLILFAPLLYLKDYPFILLFIPLLLWFKKDRILAKIKQRNDNIAHEDQKKYKPNRIIINIKSYGFYFFNMFLPKVILVNYPNLYWWCITKEKNAECYAFNYEFFKGTLAIALSILGIVFFKGNDKLFFLCMALSIMQWSAIVAAVQTNADRYMAFAIPFMMYFLAKLILMTSIPYVFLVGFCVYYITKLFECMTMYTTIDWYQRYQMFHAPYIAKPRFNRIDWYFRQKRFLTAWYLIEEGLQNMPDDFLLLYQASIALSQVGRFDQALDFLNKAQSNMYLGQEVDQQNKIEEMRFNINMFLKSKGVKHGGKKKQKT